MIIINKNKKTSIPKKKSKIQKRCEKSTHVTSVKMHMQISVACHISTISSFSAFYYIYLWFECNFTYSYKKIFFLYFFQIELNWIHFVFPLFILSLTVLYATQKYPTRRWNGNERRHISGANSYDMILIIIIIIIITIILKMK